MSALVGATVVQGLLGATQLGIGIAKARAATRPEYMLPQAIEEQMTDAEKLSYYGLPSEQKQEFLDNIARSTAGAVRGISDRRGGLGAIATASQTGQDAYKGMLSADSAARLQNLDRLQQTRSNYAQYEDKMFSLNELEPYMQEVNAASALSGAGMQNIGGALNTLAMGGIYEVFGDNKSVGVLGDGSVETATPTDVTPQMILPALDGGASSRASVITDQTQQQVSQNANSSFNNQQLMDILSQFRFNLGRP